MFIVAAAVDRWVSTRRPPRFKRPYTDLVYQPMLDLQLAGTAFVTKFALAPNGTPAPTVQPRVSLVDDGRG